MTNTDIIKCDKCGQVLISGRGCLLMFGKGTSIGCKICGNKYIFGQENVKPCIEEIKNEKILPKTL